MEEKCLVATRLHIIENQFRKWDRVGEALSWLSTCCPWQIWWQGWIIFLWKEPRGMLAPQTLRKAAHTKPDLHGYMELLWWHLRDETRLAHNPYAHALILIYFKDRPCSEIYQFVWALLGHLFFYHRWRCSSGYILRLDSFDKEIASD